MSFEEQYAEYAASVRRRLGNPSCKMCGADDDKAMEWIDAYNREVPGVILCGSCCLAAATAFVHKHGGAPVCSYKADEPKRYVKAVISRRMAKEVMERDEYRCVHCRTHLDLTCDHIIPEKLGGPTEVSNLQTLCRSCNSKKGVRA